MTVADRFCQIKEKIKEKALSCGRQPDEVTLVAVSKTYPVDCIQQVYQKGGRDFGESRVQEALQKIPQLPSDCRWHLVGPLQSNKIAKAILSFQLIHSVDTPQLAEKISQMSQAKGVVTSILLQVNTSHEKTKHGLSGEEWQGALKDLNRLPHLRIEGLMTLAPLTEDLRRIRSCFRQLFQWRGRWQSQMIDPTAFHHLSMGMSHDYLIAIEEGATLLRIGTAIFGSRDPGVLHSKV